MRKSPDLSAPSALGITLLEFVVVIIILLVLSGLLIPVARNLLISSKVNRMLATIDAARDACLRFNQDTDLLAVEDSGNLDGSPTNADPSLGLKILSSTPAVTIPGYKGPYLRRPLTFADNPYGNRVAVLNDLTVTPFGGFDLLGSGNMTPRAGNLIVFEKVAEEVAFALDEKIDPPIDGKTADTFGRCVFRSNGTTADVFVFLLAEIP